MSPTVTNHPREEYASRLKARQATFEALDQRLDCIGQARLATVLAGLVIASLVFWFRLAPIVLLALPVASLIGLFAWYSSVRRQRDRADRGRRFYERGIARLNGEWAGQGITGDSFLSPSHPCAIDLDLFGKGSIFERLCDARTRAGQATLAGWLLKPSEPQIIRARQEAIADLSERIDWRERLAMLGELMPEGVDTAGLGNWGQAPPVLANLVYRHLADALTFVFLTFLILWAAGWLTWLPAAIALIAQASYARSVRSRVKQAIAGIENKARDLMEIATVLHGIENEHFNSSHLQSLQSRIRIGSAIPSERVAQLARLVDLLNNRRNPFFAPVGVLVCWTTRLAISIDSWRARVGPTIKVWESAIGEVEALLSLAAYSFENPNDPFPEIVDHGLVVESTGLGHPLISTSHCVPNDIQLGDRPRLLLVSGSNMSGKSTLLRSVGVNVVLALAGAPVRAKSMRLSPVVVGATLRVQDSLQAGVSRFFAEITRIRQLVELTKHSPPLLFLFDELLHGTNSHDRVIGAGAILRSLVESGAIGLATTHDLALTALVEELGDRAKNVHFADELIDGRLVFDYRMRPGVVRHSNALDLMRAVGLEL